MSDIFQSLKNLMTKKGVKDDQSVLSAQTGQAKKSSVLDMSDAIYIDLPKIAEPDFADREEHRSRAYWDIYNKGVSFYNRKWYEKAKDEFLKLLDQNPHQAFYTYLLRTYRKIIDRQIEKGNLLDTYKVFDDFFVVCREHVTDIDRRKFNKLVDRLLEDNPISEYRKLELTKRERQPDFRFVNGAQASLRLVSEARIEKENRQKRRKWRFIGCIGTDTLFVESFYDEEQSKFARSFFVVRDKSGNIKKEFVADHGSYRFKSAEQCDRFVTSSDDLILYLYSVGSGCLSTYDVGRLADDKYHMRSVDVSPEGEFILFTSVDKAYLMDSGMRLIGSWRVPPKKGSEKRVLREAVGSSEEFRKDLFVLGLDGTPTDEEIKRAFRKIALEFHPDRNPDDPSSTARMQQIIAAYERLTTEEARQAFTGLENAEYYCQIIDRVKYDMPGMPFSFTMELVGPGEDWIYATCVGPGADKIYLGCYCGKVYCISRDGKVKTLVNCPNGVKSIREKGEYLFIETVYGLHIIKDGQYLNHVKNWQVGDLRWTDSGFMFVGSKELHLFSDEGIKIGGVSFKKTIYDLYWAGSNLEVITADKAFTFSIDQGRITS